LTNLGEKLSEDEVNELLKEVEVGKDGRINYVGKFYYTYKQWFLY
jgi:Ca2+-binding EF-hand superfamily protein